MGMGWPLSLHCAPDGLPEVLSQGVSYLPWEPAPGLPHNPRSWPSSEHQGSLGMPGRGCGGGLLGDAKREPWLLLLAEVSPSSASLTSSVASNLPEGLVGEM